MYAVAVKIVYFLFIILCVAFKGYSSEFTVRGNSLYPLLQPGDVVTICSVSVCEYKIDDLIIFKTPTNSGLVVKTVAGLVDEQLQLVDDGLVVINGRTAETPNKKSTLLQKAAVIMSLYITAN